MGTLSPLRLGRRPIGCRVLVLYRVDPTAAQELLPTNCRPVLVGERAIVGLCYTKLGSIRSRWLPGRLGSPSEHLAVRIPAEFNGKKDHEPGTWILRRQTSSWIEARCGDKLFRGEYERATFSLEERANGMTIDVHRGEREELHLRAETSDALAGSVFANPRRLDEFLAETQAVRPHDVFAPEADDLELHTGCVTSEPLSVLELRSAFFDSHNRFPDDAAQLDSAVRLVTRRLLGVREQAKTRRRDTIIDAGGTTPALPTT